MILGVTIATWIAIGKFVVVLIPAIIALAGAL